MTAILNVTMRASIKCDARADTETGEPHTRLTNEYDERLTYGTGANQANTFWEDTRTVSAAANDDIDLTAISMTAPIGTATVAFTCIKSVQIEVLTTTSGYYLLVGKVSSVTNGWEGPFHTVAGCVQRIEAEGVYANHQKSAAGWTVDSTHKVLRINNPSAGSVQYRITLTGEA